MVICLLRSHPCLSHYVCHRIYLCRKSGKESPENFLYVFICWLWIGILSFWYTQQTHLHESITSERLIIMTPLCVIVISVKHSIHSNLIVKSTRKIHVESQQINIRATFKDVALMLFFWLFNGILPAGFKALFISWFGKIFPFLTFLWEK